MKLFKYGLPFAALALLASCSNDKLDGPSNDNTVNAGEPLMAQFDVALPAPEGTRADGDSFGGFEGAQPGTEEATVKNVQIFIFKKAGSSEADYVCVGQSEVWTPSASNADTDVEKRVKITVQINAEEAINTGSKTGNYFGLAVVNNPTNGGLTLPTAGVSQTAEGKTVGTKFGDWASGTNAAQSYVFTYDNSSKKYFTMTNAPQWGGESVTVPAADNINTLVELDDSQFAKSPNEPAGSAGTFFVQRGVAKVRISSGSEVSFNTIPSTVSTTHKVSLTNWDIDITNLSSYPVQVVEGLTWSATADHMYLAKGTNNEEMGHLWWAKDPNYTAETTTPTSAFTFVSSLGNDVAEKAYDYCLENTMDYNQMSQDRTTRVVFKGYYSLSGTFISEEGATKGKANSFIVNPKNKEAIDIQSVLVEGSVPEAGSQKLSELIKAGNWTDNDKVKSEDFLEEAGAQLTNIQAIAILLGLDYTDATTIANYEVDFYPYGETYYVARIRHFNDSETPLNEDYAGTTVTYDESTLGRYGVLRNNIYDVVVQNVKGYGSPKIPDPKKTTPDPDDPVDPETYNINVTINVLKWAKRSFDYTLD